MNLKIEYENNQYLNFDAGLINFFLGPNSEIKWKLFRGLQRFNVGKALNELEENVYGEDGISIECDGKKLNSKNNLIMILDSRDSFLKHYTLSKGSLLLHYFENLKNDFDLNKSIYELNDKILNLETIFQDKIENELHNFVPSLHAIEFDEILKKLLIINYLENSQVFPLQMLDVNKTIEDFCRLLRNFLISESKPIWLWIKNPNSFLAKGSLKKFIAVLRKITNETKLLRVFIVSDDFLDIAYEPEDIENTVLIYNEIQQLPPYDIFLNSIKNNYPDNEFDDEEDLLGNLFKIFPYIDQKNYKNVFLGKKNMLLLKLVDELLGCNEIQLIKGNRNELTDCEENFLYGK